VVLAGTDSQGRFLAASNGGASAIGFRAKAAETIPRTRLIRVFGTQKVGDDPPVRHLLFELVCRHLIAATFSTLAILEESERRGLRWIASEGNDSSSLTLCAHASRC
jgi:hypothetical protein